MEKSLPPKLAKLLDKGLAYHRAGDVNAALEAYNAILKKQPRQPDALSLKGVALLGLGDAEAAVKFLSLAAKRRPEDAIIWNDLGMAQEAMSDAVAAHDSFNKALAIDPMLPAALVNQARYALANGSIESALAQSDQAIKAQPAFVQAQNVRGLALQALDRLDEALAAFAAALAQAPDDADALFNKGELLRQRGVADGAMIALERAVFAALEGSSVWANAMMTIGLIHAATDYDGALQHYNAVLERVPDHVSTLVNRGELKQTQGDIEGADTDFTAALKVDDGSAMARFNQACGQLLKRNWGEGWDGHEARWLINDPTSQWRARGIPEWDGSLTDGLKLLVWGEQGLGDQVLFSGQLRDLAASDVQPTVELDQRMVPLVQRSFPELPAVSYDSLPPDDLLSFDAQVAIGSLGRFLRRSSQAFPEPQAYLSADPNLAKQLRQKYLDIAAGRKIVGLAWNSINPNTGSKKSLPLDRWGTVLSVPDALFVSLQYGDVAGEVAAAVSLSGADIFIDDDVDPIADFDGAAAQIAAMDLVIATSNTAVHVAGALGVPTWVMIPIVPNWRWGLVGQSTPWYPNVRLFRQTSYGDWSPVIADVAEAFQAWRDGY
ncbi:MAG: tetratricopeptide repeat protein [Rhodospirillaceae bacterium]|jgi:tetratricopeptide (TPR) repeat protein|nr:tetratricopeptide repeat protein [Rhodospirillaceae bacterium]MBT5241124.1 tetratricopeptide repeat protein [Rhodospirillaceae bacterium]MBT5565636.1 tetratricopeptide repeat protein [Rhodospirillaceae bacterium]MBT6090842.1 tetratricopeptide repeat protein [Rhodospirillaceae bacterium]